MQQAKKYRFATIKKGNVIYLVEDRTADHADEDEAGFENIANVEPVDAESIRFVETAIGFFKTIARVTGPIVALKCIIFLFTFKG